MKLLTITKETQGKRSNDFCWAKVGEIAKFGSACDRGTVDDNCGCKRAMVGLETSKASTTVKVTDVDISLEELTLRIANSYVENWSMTVKEAMEIAHEDTEQLVSLANGFPEGRVIEIRGDKIQTRTL